MIKLLKKLLSHTNRSLYGVCSICDKKYLDSKLTTIEDLSLCPADLIIYQNHKWESIYAVESDPENPENALAVQNIKDELKKISIPSFIQTTYTEANGQVISHFNLLVPQDKIDIAKERIR